MITLILVIHVIICIALVATILLQQSEGGALGIGGGPSGLMSARGAANFLSRSTAWLAAAFIGTSILLALLSGAEDESERLRERLAAPAPVSAPNEEPPVADPLQQVPAAEAPAPSDTVPPAEQASDVPIAQ